MINSPMIVIVIVISKLLKNKAHQGTSLFTSAATNQTGVSKGGVKRSSGPISRVPITSQNPLSNIPSTNHSFYNSNLSSLWVSRTGSVSGKCALQEALYKRIDTIQYNTKSLLFSRAGVGSTSE